MCEFFSKPIPQMPRYRVSKEGVVYFAGRIVPQYKVRGYPVIYLPKRRLPAGRKNRALLVHRLVASAWLLNPKDKVYVIHLNGDRADNRACNLKWATRSETLLHAYHSGAFPPPKPRKGYRVDQLTLGGKLIRTFESNKQAHDITGVNKGNISSCCTGAKEQTAGYMWRYNYDED
jgi:hypothetical protein